MGMSVYRSPSSFARMKMDIVENTPSNEALWNLWNLLP
jgi:hypothetical protein